MLKFRANGEDLEIPDLRTVSLDESMVIYSYSHLTLDEIGDLEGTPPGVLASLVHIAVARANPDHKPKEIEKVVRALNLADLMASFEDTEAAKEVEKQDLEPSGRLSGSGEPSGNDSATSSETPPEQSHLRRIGTPELATSESRPEQGYTELAG